MKVRKAIVSAHRWVSLVALSFWVVQALTGMFCVFHWEIEDAFVPGEHRPTDFRAMERNLGRIAPRSDVGSIWTSAGAPDRYDVYLSDRSVRIDGQGNPLRVREDGERWSNGGWASTLVVLHQSLLSGAWGRYIVGTSGLLLFSNLLLGIAAAWPRRGQWGRAVRPSSAGGRVAVVYSWHRALGLWLALPALFLVAAGVLLAFESITPRVLNVAEETAPPQPAASSLNVGLARAAEIALARYPGSVISGIGFPTLDKPLWKFTIRQPEEMRRAYGKTQLFVSAVDGRIVADFDALKGPPNRRFVNSLFAFHTGEMGGMPGRILVLTIGAWLLTMIVLGAMLWWRRRRTARASAR
jgi:uncharacterized iron-regulated membrane protein